MVATLPAIVWFTFDSISEEFAAGCHFEGSTAVASRVGSASTSGARAATSRLSSAQSVRSSASWSSRSRLTDGPQAETPVRTAGRAPASSRQADGRCGGLCEGALRAPRDSWAAYWGRDTRRPEEICCGRRRSFRALSHVGKNPAASVVNRAGEMPLEALRRRNHRAPPRPRDMRLSERLVATRSRHSAMPPPS